MSAKFNSEIAVIGIDIGKNSFHIVGLDRRGAIMLAATFPLAATTPASCVRGTWGNVLCSRDF